MAEGPLAIGVDEVATVRVVIAAGPLMMSAYVVAVAAIS